MDKYWECDICGRRSNNYAYIRRCELSHRKILTVKYDPEKLQLECITGDNKQHIFNEVNDVN